MRGWSRITHSLRLPAHADASSPTAGASLCLEMRRFGPVANESAEWAAASFWADDALGRSREGRVLGGLNARELRPQLKLSDTVGLGKVLIRGRCPSAHRGHSEAQYEVRLRWWLSSAFGLNQHLSFATEES